MDAVTARMEACTGGRVIPLLELIGSPEELRRLAPQRLPEVAAALRDGIIEAVSRVGGHLGASLGTVELTTALHYVFDTPRDRLIFDVGHQAYPHKFLTGRRGEFDRIGRPGGIGKFLRRSESAYDVFGAGHAGTSISAAVGIAEAIRRRGGDEHVVAVIGDGALTAGMAYEGLNHAGYAKLPNLTVVLNDNQMSISPNVGALSRYLAGGWSPSMKRRLRSSISRLLDALSLGGDDLLGPLGRAEGSLERSLAPAHFFEALGFDYVGPVDGHDLGALVGVLSDLRHARGRRGPVLVHCRTVKGMGFEPAQREPVAYHGVTPFDIASGRMRSSGGGASSWTSVFADAIVELADEDPRIVGITAAMAEGTGLSRFQEVHPERFYDVGIAEQHAVTMAAGMATEGLKPVCCIYSTFLQRAYDQIVHDVCVQNLDVTFALDRGGLVGADGATHQGVYDYAYLRSLPNMVVMAPKDARELRCMLRTAIEHPGPSAVRYPRGAAPGATTDETIRALPVGRAELLREGIDVALIAIGASVASACAAAERLAEEGIDAAVLNARFVKPLDEASIVSLARSTRALVTIEEHVAAGGFGEAVMALLSRPDLRIRTPRLVLGLPDQIFEHGDPGQMLSEFGLDGVGIAGAVRSLLAAGEASAAGDVEALHCARGSVRHAGVVA